MEAVEMSNTSRNNTARKIDTLIAIGAGKIIDNTLNKLINYQLAKYRNNIDQIKQVLEKFEKHYNMSSDVFYQSFEAGNLGDEGDFFEWGALYENILLYEERIKKIEPLIAAEKNKGTG